MSLLSVKSQSSKSKRKKKRIRIQGQNFFVYLNSAKKTYLIR